MELARLQKVVDILSNEREKCPSIEQRALDLSHKVGNLSKEILKNLNSDKKSFHISESYEEEIGNVLFSLVCMANESNTSLEICLNKVLDRYKTQL